MPAYDHLLPLTPDLNAERLETLKKLLPDLFTNEGRLNLDELRKLADPDGLPETERYEFRWFGKNLAKRTAFTPSNATLVRDPTSGKVLNFAKGSDGDTAAPDSFIIEGENLEVLKLLLAAYRERVKCIYIDPPYNTGKDFVYSDNYTEDRRPYWENTGVTQDGVKIDTNTDADGRYHSNWLNMMYSRLLLARQLLRPDGVIFISIDDNEVTNLRKLCDEVFGEENFVANLVWERGRKNDAKLFSVGHEYIVVYMKYKDSDTVWREEKPGAEDILKEYKRLKNEFGDDYNQIQIGIRQFYDSLSKTQPNHPALKHRRYNRIDKNGIWRDDNISWPGGKGPKYDVIHPVTGQPCKVPDAGWRFSTHKKFMLYDENGFIFYRDNHSEPPMLKRYLNHVSTDFDPDVKRRSNADDSDDEVNVQVMPSVFYKNAQPTVVELRKLMGLDLFDNPKDPELLKRWISYVTDQNDLILDFFAGSGTTGQAVMELNAEDGGNRRFILVQIPEATDPASEAHKAGYKKISDITVERCRRVAEKIAAGEATSAKRAKTATPEAAPLFAANGSEPDEPLAKFETLPKVTPPTVGPPNVGFQVLRLQKSYFPRTEWTPDPAKSDAENEKDLRDYVRLKESQLVTLFNREELISEILLKQGFLLNYSVVKLDTFAKNDLFRCTDGEKEAWVCLDNQLFNETLQALFAAPPPKFICLERTLDTTQKWNLKHTLGDRFHAF